MYTRFFWKILEHREWVTLIVALPGPALVTLKAVLYTYEHPSRSGSADAGVLSAVFLPTFLVTAIAVRIWIEQTNGYFTSKQTALGKQFKSDLTNLLLGVCLYLFHFLSLRLLARAPGGTEVFVLALSDAILFWLLLSAVASILLSFNFLYKAIRGHNFRLPRFLIFIIVSTLYLYFAYYGLVRLIPDTWWSS